MGAEVEVRIDPGTPVTYNDPQLAAAMAPTLEDVYGPENVSIARRITGAEDFAFYQQGIPGFFFFIGGRPADIPAEKAIPNHSPYFFKEGRSYSSASRRGARGTKGTALLLLVLMMQAIPIVPLDCPEQAGQ